MNNELKKSITLCDIYTQIMNNKKPIVRGINGIKDMYKCTIIINEESIKTLTEIINEL